MPVIVIGADTETGRAIVEGLAEPDREIRAFVTDVESAGQLKGLGVKVAVGDVSDETHIEGAATACFSAILIAEAASDDRERAFATHPDAVYEAWSRGIAASGLTRAIWVSDDEPPESKVPEVAVVAPDDPGLVEKVVALDDARKLSGETSG